MFPTFRNIYLLLIQHIQFSLKTTILSPFAKLLVSLGWSDWPGMLLGKWTIKLLMLLPAFNYSWRVCSPWKWIEKAAYITYYTSFMMAFYYGRHQTSWSWTDPSLGQLAIWNSWLCWGAFKHVLGREVGWIWSKILIVGFDLLLFVGCKYAPQVFKRLYLWNRMSDWPRL